MTGFRVVADALATHADQVDGYARRLAAVGDAGRHTQRLSEEAYGLIGQLFTGAARDGIDRGVADIATVAGAAGTLASGLRASATCYGQAEQANTGLFGGVR